MKNRIISLVTIMILVISILVGCNHQNDYHINSEVGSSKGSEIIDMAGRTVKIPDKVDKVFSTGPVGTILIYSLSPDKMVGWNYDLKEGEKRFILEKYHDLPNLGGAGKESINAEELLKVNPNLLLMMGKLDNTTISQADEMEEQLGKPVILLDDDINKLDEAYEILGKVLGEEKRAEELGNYCRKTLEEVEKNKSELTKENKKNIYYAEGPNGLQTEPAGSWHAEIIDMVGGENVAEVEVKGEKGKSDISIEQLLTWNPDIIISWGDERGGYYSEIFKDPVWEDIEAVKNKEVYEIPNKPFNWFDRPPSVNRILGLKWMGNLLYPSLYNYNMEYEVKEFYDMFYHYQLTEDEANEILKNAIRH